jgi:hypothetical protein
MILGIFFNLSTLSTKIFMYRFPCISDLKSKTEEIQRDRKYAQSIFHAEFKKRDKNFFGLRDGSLKRIKHLKIDISTIKKTLFQTLLIFLDFLVNNESSVRKNLKKNFKPSVRKSKKIIKV